MSIKVQLTIPDEFIENFNKDRFKECFERCNADITYALDNGQISTAGNYERETLTMLTEAFDKARVVGREQNKIIYNKAEFMEKYKDDLALYSAFSGLSENEIANKILNAKCEKDLGDKIEMVDVYPKDFLDPDIDEGEFTFGFKMCSIHEEINGKKKEIDGNTIFANPQIDNKQEDISCNPHCLAEDKLFGMDIKHYFKELKKYLENFVNGYSFFVRNISNGKTYEIPNSTLQGACDYYLSKDKITPEDLKYGWYLADYYNCLAKTMPNFEKDEYFFDFDKDLKSVYEIEDNFNSNRAFLSEPEKQQFSEEELNKHYRYLTDLEHFAINLGQNGKGCNLSGFDKDTEYVKLVREYHKHTDNPFTYSIKVYFEDDKGNRAIAFQKDAPFQISEYDLKTYELGQVLKPVMSSLEMTTDLEDAWEYCGGCYTREKHTNESGTIREIDLRESKEREEIEQDEMER